MNIQYRPASFGSQELVVRPEKLVDLDAESRGLYLDRLTMQVLFHEPYGVLDDFCELQIEGSMSRLEMRYGTGNSGRWLSIPSQEECIDPMFTVVNTSGTGAEGNSGMSNALQATEVHPFGSILQSWISILAHEEAFFRLSIWVLKNLPTNHLLNIELGINSDTSRFILSGHLQIPGISSPIWVSMPMFTQEAYNCYGHEVHNFEASCHFASIQDLFLKAEQIQLHNLQRTTLRNSCMDLSLPATLPTAVRFTFRRRMPASCQPPDWDDMMWHFSRGYLAQDIEVSKKENHWD
ncbi:hypothetical protein TREMEDRAFT_61335 [Tremella mesenterica DSM 1558]|uniref:uncharacterized protein n=1 Tax=Tremella mesenterica (strain ATCC 24925 / CBS 8224 / DSM 1558 / NBRC 9311 / NRRL Y-6157 / RJB 2259-6 / UBC 559-6) TaxID=578456 RepID=UPI0003F497A4|nr:uncharacterized protein TREMEDRAFT_61335 [Tremella mesenterica DSM 1558]EIW70829.1 hypothetical protein TREMEDRAFT_61335 [Tremella mesenterica DSM 1558]